MDCSRSYSQFQRSSDIFHVTNLNKPEINLIPRRQRSTNKQSENFLNWENNSSVQPKQCKTESNTLKSTVFSNEPLPPHKAKWYKAKEATICLGTDDNSSYKLKRDHSDSSYDPGKYLKDSSAFERKITQLYGEKGKNSIGTKKSSIGTIRTEIINLDNPKQVKCETAKQRKYFTFYGNSLSGKANYDKGIPLPSNNSGTTKNKEDKKEKYSTVEMMKSNIFNDPDIENKNKNLFVKSVKKEKPNKERNSRPLNVKKKNIYLTEDEACFSQLDWKDMKTNLLFKKKPNKLLTEGNAQDKKISSIYGKQTKANPKKEKEENDGTMREEMEKMIQTEYPKENQSQIKKRVNNLSSFQGKKFVTETPKTTKEEPKTRTFEFTNFNNLNQVNIPQIEKLFKSRGVHIYGLKTDESYISKDQKGRITFSLREGPNEKAFENKLNDVKKILKDQQGLEVEVCGRNKTKIKAQNTPATAKWSTSNIEVIARGRVKNPAKDEKIHLRPRTKEQRITAMGPANFNYKRK